jgi:hypothetical protein
VSIYWVGVFSFLMGACGYIIVRFWIIPISRYRRAKRRLRGHLTAYRRLLPGDDAARLKGPVSRKTVRDIRRWGVKLADLHDEALPYWYRLVLMTRKESPREATEPILRLENMPTSRQARECIQEIGRHLGFKGFDN